MPRAVGRGNIWIENSISNQVVGFLNRRNLPRLTPREYEIVALICRGMKNKQIADSLNITIGTVKVHLMHIFEKTGVKDRFELGLGSAQTDRVQCERRCGATSSLPLNRSTLR